MPWFFNSHTGKLVHEDPPSPGYYIYESLLKSGTGWHELTVPDSASESQAAANAAAAYPGSPKANSETPSGGGLGGTVQGIGNEATGTAGAAGSNLLNAFNLNISGVAPWFFRALMLGGGVFLMALGISKLTGADNKITELAGKIPVVPL